MKLPRLVDIVPSANGISYGAKISADEQTPAPSILPAATEQLIDWARCHWDEVDPDEFEWGLGRKGMEVRHRETGAMVRIRVGMPFGGEIASGITAFCVRQGRLFLLADREDRPTSQFSGRMTSRMWPADQPWSPPAEGEGVKVW